MFKASLNIIAWVTLPYCISFDGEKSLSAWDRVQVVWMGWKSLEWWDSSLTIITRGEESEVGEVFDDKILMIVFQEGRM